MTVWLFAAQGQLLEAIVRMMISSPVLRFFKCPALLNFLLAIFSLTYLSEYAKVAWGGGTGQLERHFKTVIIR